MDLIKAITVFSEVAKQESFAGAARALGLSTTSVSRQVIDLEAWLEVGLLHRTTRKLSLTEEGAYYLDELRKVLDDIDRVRATAHETVRHPSGTLRLTAPPFVVKECIQPVLPGFLEAHKNVGVELTAIDRFVDLVEEGFDLALRIGDLPDSSMIARKLGDTELVIIGSPTYLKAGRKPKTPADLAKHNCIVDTVATFNNRWPIKRVDKRQHVTVQGNVAVNSGEIARDLAVHGAGLALLPRFFVNKQLENGELVEVLKGQVDGTVGFYAVYPQSRHVAPKVRAFIDYVVDFLRK